MNTQALLIELRALELFNAHYACRPWLTARDYSAIEFYKRVAADEVAGVVPDLDMTRKEMGGSFQ